MDDEKKVLNEETQETESSNKIVLLDEDNQECEFELVCNFFIGEKQYVILAENEDSDDVFPFQIVDEKNGNMSLLPIDSEEEFAQVEEMYNQIMDEDMEEDECGCGCEHHHHDA